MQKDRTTPYHNKRSEENTDNSCQSQVETSEYQVLVVAMRRRMFTCLSPPTEMQERAVDLAQTVL